MSLCAMLRRYADFSLPPLSAAASYAYTLFSRDDAMMPLIYAFAAMLLLTRAPAYTPCYKKVVIRSRVERYCR